MREQCSSCVRALQDTITNRLLELEPTPLQEDVWERPGGGGGRTRSLAEGKLFERAGVNVSEVHGELPAEFAESLPGAGREFFATGLSLVLHPTNPHVPTVHANFRYIEKGGAWWFGGGSDLTPYRLYEEDARHFHAVWREVCDRHDPEYYPRFKKSCDEYFYLPHRKETRGVGGIFFDQLTGERDALFGFWRDAGAAFLDSYVPIVERRRGEPYTEEERRFQLLRRGRYVEFNLMYDRGTVFGLRTGGRIESILISLPPSVRWDYEVQFPAGSPQADLIDVLRQPRDWLGSESGPQGQDD